MCFQTLLGPAPWSSGSPVVPHAEGLGFDPQRGGPPFFSGLAVPDEDKSWLQN